MASQLESAHRSVDVSRRRFLGLAGVTGLAVLGLDAHQPSVTDAVRNRAWAAPRPLAGEYPFTLGVASGDPNATGFVLWTRLAPDPLDPSAIPDPKVPVYWEVFADENLNQRVAHGSAMARRDNAHSVHVEVDHLRPDRWYWYRFMTQDHESPTGRTRTFPSYGQPGARLRFASVSCQMYEHGYYTAYQHMAHDDLDLVIHTGDYIYEHGPNEYTVPEGNPRRHDGPEVSDLTSYRNRHALYRTDSDLAGAHASFPFIMSWDDHEVDNNWADEIPEDDQDPDEFMQRRANGFKAYWEHMPLRRRSRPQGPDMLMYRRLKYGKLLNLSLLDTRQYRTDQPCDDGSDVVPCGDWGEPDHTLTGGDQEAWLFDNLASSSTTWNVISQQVFMAQRDVLFGEGKRLSMDSWDGYPVARERLLSHVTEHDVDNLVVLTGDVHRHWAADLKADFDDPDSAILGSELVCTSITSGGDGSDDRQDAVRAENPHIHYCITRRGYLRHDVTPDQWRADFLTVPYVHEPGAPIAVDGSFAIEAGNPGLQPV